MIKSYVHAQLPRAGMGNKLLVWARATVFARKHDLPLHVNGWVGLHIGPHLRRERSKRFYLNYFNQQHIRGPVHNWAASVLTKAEYEPNLEMSVLPHDMAQNTRFIFHTVPSWSDYSAGLRGHEGLLRAEFKALLHAKYQHWLNDQDRPTIGVHVRRGDFRPPEQGEVIGTNCNIRTPISHYVDAIKQVRRATERTLPATIFTDGTHSDVAELLALPNVHIATPNPDIVDLLRLSQSQIIIPSFASTFSHWASFISDAAVIKHPAQTDLIRSPESGFLEFALPEDAQVDDAIVQKIAASIRHD